MSQDTSRLILTVTVVAVVACLLCSVAGIVGTMVYRNFTATREVVEKPTTETNRETVVDDRQNSELKLGCSGEGCVVQDFSPMRTGTEEWDSYPVYVDNPQEVWTAGYRNGEWQILFALPGCRTSISIATAEHNTITFSQGVTTGQIGQARSIWVQQLYEAPGSPYDSSTPILYCSDTTGYK